MNFLEFANPAGWWWAALALPILAFYILKVRLRRESVSTLLFWDRVFDEKKPRSWWQQLRHWLSLLLQWAFLLLVVGALVDPLWTWQKNERRKIVLVIDNSASMKAIDGTSSRIDLAKQAARALVRSMRPGDEMAVITAGGRPQVAMGLSDHGRSLLECIETLPTTDAPTVLGDAVAAARRLISGDEQSRIYVLTDGCSEEIEGLQADEKLTIYGCGSQLDNIGITQFQVRRSLLDAIGYQVLIEVSNLGEAEHDCRLELLLEDQLVDVIPLSLAVGESKILNLDQASAVGGRLEARIDSRDALEQDNVARAILPIRQPIPITLATPGSVFLKSVFESIPLVQLTMVDAPSVPPASTNQLLPPGERDAIATIPLATGNPSAATANGILVFHRIIPEKIPNGRVLIVDPQNSTDLWQLGEKIEQPIVAAVSDSSPITQHVRLDNVVFPAARQLSFAGKATALVRTPLDEPLLAQLPRPRGDCLVLSVDLDQGDLPLRIAFPVLMKNAIEWFQGTAGDLRPAVATGELLTIALEDEGKLDVGDSESENATTEVALTVVEADFAVGQGGDYELLSPDGTAMPLARGQGSVTIGPLLDCGIWSVRPKLAAAGTIDRQPPTGRQSPGRVPVSTVSQNELAQLPTELPTLIACNLSNKQESNLKPRISLPSPAHLGMIGLGGRSLWFYLALAGLVLIAVEWWLYQRRLVG